VCVSTAVVKWRVMIIMCGKEERIWKEEVIIL
jgi:hypothetical protein